MKYWILFIFYSAVKMVKEVKKTQPMIQILLNQGDYVGALDLISETNKALQGNETLITESYEDDEFLKKSCIHFIFN